MSNVLLVTYPFPPGGGVEVSRALGYVRYLPAQGCRMSVLTVTEPGLRDNDPELCKLVPGDITVHRAWCPEVPISLRYRVKSLATEASPDAKSASFRWLAQQTLSLSKRILFPDLQTTWTALAFRKACRIVQSQAIDTVIVNVPPFSTLKIGIALKQRFPNLTLISDFRDEWVEYSLKFFEHASEDKIRRARKLEAAAVDASSYVSISTGKWAEQLRERYPGQPAGKFICTPNGYDPEIFRNFSPQPRRDGKMVITYFGKVWNNRIYSPQDYLEAIESLPDEICSRIETRFIGPVFPNTMPLLSRRKANVRLQGFMPKLEGIRRLQETDFALLIATDAGSHAGKLFDYLGCGKPILALSPPMGEIGRLLERTRSGWCADPWDKVAIREMILSAYRRLTQGGPIINPDREAVRAYSWPEILARFAVASGIGDAQPSRNMEVCSGTGCPSERLAKAASNRA